MQTLSSKLFVTHDHQVWKQLDKQYVFLEDVPSMVSVIEHKNNFYGLTLDGSVYNFETSEVVHLSEKILTLNIYHKYVGMFVVTESNNLHILDLNPLRLGQLLDTGIIALVLQNNFKMNADSKFIYNEPRILGFFTKDGFNIDVDGNKINLKISDVAFIRPSIIVTNNQEIYSYEVDKNVPDMTDDEIRRPHVCIKFPFEKRKHHWVKYVYKNIRVCDVVQVAQHSDVLEITRSSDFINAKELRNYTDMEIITKISSRIAILDNDGKLYFEGKIVEGNSFHTKYLKHFVIISDLVDTDVLHVMDSNDKINQVNYLHGKQKNCLTILDYLPNFNTRFGRTKAPAI